MADNKDDKQGFSSIVIHVDPGRGDTGSQNLPGGEPSATASVTEYEDASKQKVTQPTRHLTTSGPNAELTYGPVAANPDYQSIVASNMMDSISTTVNDQGKIVYNVPEEIAERPQWKQFVDSQNKQLTNKTLDEVKAITDSKDYANALGTAINNSVSDVLAMNSASAQSGQKMSSEDVDIQNTTSNMANNLNSKGDKLNAGTVGVRLKDGNVEKFDASKGLTGDDIKSLFSKSLLDETYDETHVRTGFDLSGVDLSKGDFPVYKNIKYTEKKKVYQDFIDAVDRNKGKNIFEWSQDDKNELWGAVSNLVNTYYTAGQSGVELNDSEKKAYSAALGYMGLLQKAGFAQQSAVKQTRTFLETMVVNPVVSLIGDTISFPVRAAAAWGSASTLPKGSSLGDIAATAFNNLIGTDAADYVEGIPVLKTKHWSLGEQSILGERGIQEYETAGAITGVFTAILAGTKSGAAGVGPVARSAARIKSTLGSMEGMSVPGRIVASIKTSGGLAKDWTMVALSGELGERAFNNISRPIKTATLETMMDVAPKTTRALSRADDGFVQRYIGDVVDSNIRAGEPRLNAMDTQSARQLAERYVAAGVTDPSLLVAIGDRMSFDDILRWAGHRISNLTNISPSSIADAAKAMDDISDTVPAAVTELSDEASRGSRLTSSLRSIQERQSRYIRDLQERLTSSSETRNIQNLERGARQQDEALTNEMRALRQNESVNLGREADIAREQERLARQRTTTDERTLPSVTELEETTGTGRALDVEGVKELDLTRQQNIREALNNAEKKMSRLLDSGEATPELEELAKMSGDKRTPFLIMTSPEYANALERKIMTADQYLASRDAYGEELIRRYGGQPSETEAAANRRAWLRATDEGYNKKISEIENIVKTSAGRGEEVERKARRRLQLFREYQDWSRVPEDQRNLAGELGTYPLTRDEVRKLEWADEHYEDYLNLGKRFPASMDIDPEARMLLEDLIDSTPNETKAAIKQARADAKNFGKALDNTSPKYIERFVDVDVARSDRKAELRTAIDELDDRIRTYKKGLVGKKYLDKLSHARDELAASLKNIETARATRAQKAGELYAASDSMLTTLEDQVKRATKTLRKYGDANLPLRELARFKADSAGAKLVEALNNRRVARQKALLAYRNLARNSRVEAVRQRALHHVRAGIAREAAIAALKNTLRSVPMNVAASFAQTMAQMAARRSRGDDPDDEEYRDTLLKTLGWSLAFTLSGSALQTARPFLDWATNGEWSKMRIRAEAFVNSGFDVVDKAYKDSKLGQILASKGDGGVAYQREVVSRARHSWVESMRQARSRGQDWLSDPTARRAYDNYRHAQNVSSMTYGGNKRTEVLDTVNFTDVATKYSNMLDALGVRTSYLGVGPRKGKEQPLEQALADFINYQTLIDRNFNYDDEGAPVYIGKGDIADKMSYFKLRDDALAKMDKAISSRKRMSVEEFHKSLFNDKLRASKRSPRVDPSDNSLLGSFRRAYELRSNYMAQTGLSNSQLLETLRGDDRFMGTYIRVAWTDGKSMEDIKNDVSAYFSTKTAGANVDKIIQREVGNVGKDQVMANPIDTLIKSVYDVADVVAKNDLNKIMAQSNDALTDNSRFMTKIYDEDEQRQREENVATYDNFVKKTIPDTTGGITDQLTFRRDEDGNFEGQDLRELARRVRDDLMNKDYVQQQAREYGVEPQAMANSLLVDQKGNIIKAFKDKMMHVGGDSLARKAARGLDTEIDNFLSGKGMIFDDLTAQRKSKAEIDAARKAVHGMSTEQLQEFANNEGLNPTDRAFLMAELQFRKDGKDKKVLMAQDLAKVYGKSSSEYAEELVEKNEGQLINTGRTPLEKALPGANLFFRRWDSWAGDFFDKNGFYPKREDFVDAITKALNGRGDNRLVTETDKAMYRVLKLAEDNSGVVTTKFLQDNGYRLHLSDTRVTPSQAARALSFIPKNGIDLAGQTNAPTIADVKSATILAGESGKPKLSGDIIDYLTSRATKMTTVKQARAINSPLAGISILDGKGSFYDALNSRNKATHLKILEDSTRRAVESVGGKLEIPGSLAGKDRAAYLERAYMKARFERARLANPKYTQRLRVPATKTEEGATLPAHGLTSPERIVVSVADGKPVTEFNEYNGTFVANEQHNRRFGDDDGVTVGTANIVGSDDDRAWATITKDLSTRFKDIPEMQPEIETLKQRVANGVDGSTLSDLPMVQQALNASYGIDGIRIKGDGGDTMIMFNGKSAQNGGWWDTQTTAGKLTPEDLHNMDANNALWAENVTNARNDDKAKALMADEAVEESPANVTVYVDGKKRVYRVDNPRLQKTILNTSVKALPPMLKMIRNFGMWTSNAMRLGTTGWLKPQYLATNYVRDSMQAAIMGGSRSFGSRFGEDIFKAIFPPEMKQLANDAYKIYSPANSSYDVAQANDVMRNSPLKGQKERYRILNEYRGSRPDRISRPSNLNDFMAKPSEAVEENRRKQIFINYYNSSLTDNLPDYYAGNIDLNTLKQRAVDDATFMSRTVTVDFSNKMKYLNNLASTVPYFRTAVNSTRSFGRVFMRDPVGVMSRILSGAGAYAAMIYDLVSDPETAAIYSQIPEYERQSTLPIVNKQTGSYIALPLPQEIVAVLAPVRAAIESGNDIGNSGVFSNMMAGIANMSPVDFSGFFERDINGDIDTIKGLDRVLNSLTPNALTPFIEAALNRNLYTGTSLHPSKQDLIERGIDNPKPSDYGYSSNPLLNDMANTLHIPVAYIRNGLQRWFGSGTTGLIDSLAGVLNTGDATSGNLTKGVTISFFHNSPTGARNAWQDGVDDLYTKRDELKAKLTQRNVTQKDRDEAIKEFIQDVKTFYNTYADYYAVAGGLTDKQREQAISILNLGYTNAGTTEYTNDIVDEADMEEYNLAVQRAIDAGILPPEGTKGMRSGRFKTDRDTGETYIDYTTPAEQVLKSTVYGTPKKAAWEMGKVLDDKSDGISLKQLKKQANDALQPYYDRLKAGEKLTDDDYKAMDNIRSQYMDVFYQKLDPVINKYGASILNNSDVVEKLNDYTMISSDDWKKSIDLYSKRGKQYNRYISSSLWPNATADVKQILLEHYGLGGRDTSNIDTDQDLRDLQTSLNEALSQGENGRARAIQNQIMNQIKQGRGYMSDQDMSRIPAYWQ